MEEGAEFLDPDVVVTERAELNPEIVETTQEKIPEEGNESENESPDKNGPLKRKGGFRVSPGTTRKSSW